MLNTKKIEAVTYVIVKRFLMNVMSGRISICRFFVTPECDIHQMIWMMSIINAHIHMQRGQSR